MIIKSLQKLVKDRYNKNISEKKAYQLGKILTDSKINETRRSFQIQKPLEKEN